LTNPVRRGIVSEWRQYPFLGGTLYDEAAGDEPPPWYPRIAGQAVPRPAPERVR
jgi:hypothetical protein